jgi:hypothetical protein
MQPRSVIITALILAAILAGTLIYLLNSPANKDQVAQASPSPTFISAPTPDTFIFASPTPLALPVVSPTPEASRVPRITSEAARSTQVKPTAATGPEEWIVPALIFAIVAGGAGLSYQLKQL